jgi:phage terminase large subunit-like protein
MSFMPRARNFSTDRLAALPEAQRVALWQGLSQSQRADLLNRWDFLARSDQLAPEGTWRIWLVLSGRGWGKTKSLAGWVHEQIRQRGPIRVAIVAPTAGDARDVIVEGASGLLASAEARDGAPPIYEPSKRRVTWSNGATVTMFSAEEPDRLRGPQFHIACLDEVAAYPGGGRAVFDMLSFGLRLGDKPQTLITTTPRPIPLLKELIGRARSEANPTGDVALVRRSTYDNAANLAVDFLAAMRDRYEGTALGAQELHGAIMDEVAGALWTRGLIEKTRVRPAQVPDLVRKVVAIDPAVSSAAHSDETGIVVAGIAQNGELYVIDDMSGRYKPHEWARRALLAFDKHKCDRIVAEANQGGDMIEGVLRQINVELPGGAVISGANVPYRKVHARDGKRTRAEPIAARFEQGRAHLVHGLDALEGQLCTWDPLGNDPSPDRLDAMVWALTELGSGKGISVKFLKW